MKPPACGGLRLGASSTSAGAQRTLRRKGISGYSAPPQADLQHGRIYDHDQDVDIRAPGNQEGGEGLK